MRENPEKREQWQRHVDGWRSSGVTRKAYCEQNGIKLSTLDYWCKKLSPSGKENNKGKAGWIPLRVDEDESSSAIDL